MLDKIVELLCVAETEFVKAMIGRKFNSFLKWTNLYISLNCFLRRYSGALAW